MFGNRYNHFTSSAQLKAVKVHKPVVPQGPNLSEFKPFNKELLTLGNFGLEMLKFLSKPEQMIYEGGVSRTASDEDAHLIAHGQGEDAVETYVSEEWYNAFNEYEISTDEAARLGLPFFNEDMDEDEDGYINNVETIRWAELVRDDDLRVEDGLENDRSTWIAGQSHRVASFGPFGSGETFGYAGAGTGAQFENIKFQAIASDWNHVTNQANPVAEESHFLGALGALGFSWNDVKALLTNEQIINNGREIRNPLRGLSFYDIVMQKKYNALDAKNATMLIAAMYESRERAWNCMSEVFGPVVSTMNDEDMIANMDAFISDYNPYLDSHAISLFPFFLYIQHSVLGQMTMFYERGSAYDLVDEGEDAGNATSNSRGDGYNESVLDREMFRDFVEWCGRGKYNADNDIEIPEPMREGGKLFNHRDSFEEGSDRYNAVNNLIEAWFGATERAEEPRHECYHDVIAEDGGDIWRRISGGGVTVEYDAYLDDEGRPVDASGPVTAVRYRDPEYSSRSRGWDRKWDGDDIQVQDADGRIYIVKQTDRSSRQWNELHNLIFSESQINPLTGVAFHRHYTASQFDNLSALSVMGGERFADNWSVHAIGMLLKNGEMMNMIKIMERCAAKRTARSDFKENVKDYQERLEELQTEEMLEQQAMEKAAQRAQAEKKKLLNRLKKRRNNQTPSNGLKGVALGHEQGTKEYKQAMQKLSQRLLQSSGKHKAWLKKIKDQNK